jgi:hypothetical protein
MFGERRRKSGSLPHNSAVRFGTDTESGLKEKSSA